MLRPDKVIFSIKEYVTKHMGEEFINIPLFDMATSFAESSKTTPLILILSPGCDPLASFHNFIPEDPEQRPVDRKILSLGQGQVCFSVCLHFHSQWARIFKKVQDKKTCEIK